MVRSNLLTFSVFFGNKKVHYITAYVHREFNVIAVDWEAVSAYPCYLSSLSNTRLVAQCSAQVFFVCENNNKKNN